MRRSNLQLYMTGFGPFKAITVNPSAMIGESVSKKMMEDSELQVHYEKLEVGLEAVSAYFGGLEAALAQHMEDNPDGCVLLLHIGLHSREEEGKMRLEVCGYNELEGSPIDESIPMDVRLESMLVHDGCDESKATAVLIEELNAAISKRGRREGDRQQPHWIISHDAGRYYCNYTLYRSLKLQKKWRGRVFAVFVHVANPFTCNNPSLEEQTAQVLSLASGLVRIVRNKDIV
ncbi:pyroglutamyl-peptidase I (PGP) [Trypanosoma cruzi Dm28c]|uniref:Pyroglutamyl-peptidase I (PGP) n=1 Tax=Trypanosoma cruzi Dm28c TaxID=1416333 RepID=V5BNH8_TRYCR|nr:pyroglutamyl-peptidase I (PGP) [Trypanosoma cruzi Dm28c]PBJ69971.1 pyroglutamyl-peptidase I (PGP) [Trypanosoma cruzi cruzi]